MVEFIFFREIRVERLSARLNFLLHLGQAVIRLRPNNQINCGLATHDLFTLSLSDTARYTNLQVRLIGLQRLETAQFGVDLFSGLLADVASVEQNHVCFFGAGHFCVALGAHRLSHAFTVIDVHLTAVGFDKQLLGVSHDKDPCWLG